MEKCRRYSQILELKTLGNENEPRLQWPVVKEEPVKRPRSAQHDSLAGKPGKPNKAKTEGLWIRRKEAIG